MRRVWRQIASGLSGGSGTKVPHLLPTGEAARMGLAAAAYLTLLYAAVFVLTGRGGPLEALGSAVQNVLPLGMLGALAFLLTERWTVKRKLRSQIVVHLAAPLLFGLAWYLGIQVVRGLNPAVLTRGLEPRAFALVVLAWQIVQGALAYAAIAAAGCWRAERSARLAAEAAEPGGAAPAAPVSDRLLVRESGAVRPVRFAEIELLQRTEDYTEIVTRTGRHLTARSLAKLQSALPESDFVRVHRSFIINLNAVTGAEPAGNGRMTVFLAGGEVVETSRAGRAAFLARAA
jgi:DNA-binding LytR/AlgR family response regulator